MPQFVIPAPPGFAETDAGRIQAYLANRGYAVDGVSTAADATGAVVSVTVWADRDPAAEFAAYTPTDTPDQAKQKQAIQAMRAALAAIRAKPQAQWTPTEQAIAAIVVYLRADS